MTVTTLPQTEPINLDLSKTQITADSLISTLSILNGGLQVLNSSLTPGHLSAELHNARNYMIHMIRDLEAQISKMRKLGVEVDKAVKVSDIREKKIQDKKKKNKKKK